MARADKNSITEYLLGRLTEAEEEQVELRLLTDPEFTDEFDIVVNEVIDDYICGKFEGEELKQVEEYFFRSPERRNKLKFTLALKEHGKREGPVVTPELTVSQPRDVDVSPPKWKFTKQLAIAASILIVIGAGFGVWRLYFYQSDLDKGLVALRSAFKDERPIEPRLSDFNYAPLPNQRGGPGKFDYVQRDLAANLLLKEASEQPSAASYHALGQYYLAVGNVDQAIDQFAKALARDANNAKIHNDLGAALIVKAGADRSWNMAGQEMLERSLASLNRALELNPNLPEALFNRALAYENLHRPNEALSDWEQYRRVDPASQWAAEARQHIQHDE